jgi:hypothetical protein
MINHALHYILLFRAWYRTWCGFCPSCNSDIPTKLDCDVCHNYHPFHPNPWYPPLKLRKEWWRRFKELYPAPLLSPLRQECRCCKTFTNDVRNRRMNTQYADDSQNSLISCEACYLRSEEEWAERWAEYYAGRL